MKPPTFVYTISIRGITKGRISEGKILESQKGHVIFPPLCSVKVLLFVTIKPNQMFTTLLLTHTYM